MKSEPLWGTRLFASFNFAVLLLTLGLGAVSSAQAASDSWNVDAAGNWNANGSWLSGTQVPGSTTADNSDVATFSKTLTAGRTATVDTGRYIGGIDFGNSSAFGYSLNGGTLFLNNGGLIQTLPGNGAHQDVVFSPITIDGSGTATATIFAGATLATSSLQMRQVTGSAIAATTTTLNLNGANTGGNVFAGTISDGLGGPLSILKSGTGNWELQGNHTYTGPTTINAGVFNVGGSAGNLGGGNYAGNITNNGIFIYKSSFPQTLSGNISGSGLLVVSNAGPRVTLYGTNTYTGGTSNSSIGILVFGNTAAKPATGMVIATNTGGIGLGVATSGPYFTSADVNSLWANTLPGVGIAQISRVGIDTTAGDFTYTLPGLPSHPFEKLGVNTLNLAGVNTSTNDILAEGGILNIAGTVNNSPGITKVSDFFGAKGMLLVPTGGKYTTAEILTGQYTAGGAPTFGSLVVNGGDLVTTTTTLEGLRVGWGTYGGFFMSSGSVKTFWYDGGVGNVLPTSVNVGQIKGGNFTNSNFIILRGAYNEFTLIGGSVIRPSAGNAISVGETGSNAVFTVAGGLLDNTGQTVTFGRTAASTSKSSVNLNGGTMLTGTSSGGFIANAANITGSAFVNFNGGTLKASAASTTFLPVGITAAYVNGAFGTYAGGAVVDNNNFDITFVKPLLAPNGNGVSGLSYVAGSGYIGAPYVEITGGGGSNATAYAQVNLDPASGTFGQITNVVLSNPGVGYTSTPTVSLRGGGGSGAAVSAIGITANTSGGLIKNGSGVLTLSGANTYTGPTAVSNGTLKVNGSLAVGSAVTVSSGGTLGGSGTIAGTVVVVSGATLSPGNSIGTLTLGEAPTLGGTTLMEVSGPSSADKLNVTSGTVVFGGTLTVTNIGPSLTHGNTFDLFDGTLSGSFSTLNLPNGPAHWNTTALNVSGTISYVNNSPVAANFSLGVAVGGSTTASVVGKYVTDAEADVVTITAVSTPANGTATIVSGTSITYTNTSAAGSDSFTYTVSDGLGGTATKTVTVSISSPQGFNLISGPTPVGGGQYQFDYLGIPGQQYAIDETSSLTPPITWSPVTTNTAAGNGALTFTITPANPSGFFRTRSMP